MHTKPVSFLNMELVDNMQVMVLGLIVAFTRCTAQRKEEVFTRLLTPFLNLMLLVYRDPFTSFLMSHTTQDFLSHSGGDNMTRHM